MPVLFGKVTYENQRLADRSLEVICRQWITLGARDDKMATRHRRRRVLREGPGRAKICRYLRAWPAA